MSGGKVDVSFKPAFIRQFKKLTPLLREEVFQKIEIFRKRSEHAGLKVHKLHGSLADFYSFSVNYRYRVVFKWEDVNKAVLLAIGDHDVYK